ncbi:hypothetical protein HYFRA_00006714 [Hymenoscyphus fraxineus]|uniref:Uncharacterized protein n=1 Tax=Hymenoscyphus fraxineus TaxID=746836 RepID=A0A9N9KXK1_9HELO|nr:hypothetical protein HYFRA_00006714 [Hymenoscyphus fraxineus]
MTMSSQALLHFQQWSSEAKSCDCFGGMAQQTSTNNALGTLIGYVGAEAATNEIFERLLWPQRFYNDFGWHNIIRMTLFLPMGAPLHKAALATLIQIHKNGLFRGHEQGHMLGSPFFYDSRISYLAHNCFDIDKPEKDLVRNGLWLRAIANFPLPSTTKLDGSRSVETGLRDAGIPGQHRIRAINRVSHLRISVPDYKPHTSEIIGNETGRTTLKNYFALLATEFTGVLTGITVAIVWKTGFMLLWFAPLILKVVSAYLAVSRGSLEVPPQIQFSGPTGPENDLTPLSEKLQDTSLTNKKFEIHDTLNGFLVIEGDENIILQFFRHYGHPIRNRFREVSQIIIIVAFGALFPIGTICSILWMPIGLQYTWLAYQLYATLAMYVYNFSDGHSLGTTEKKIAQQWTNQRAKGKKNKVYFGSKEGVLMAELEVTCHNRVKDGKDHMKTLLSSQIQRPDKLSCQSSGSGTMTTSSSTDKQAAGLASRNVAVK